MMVLTIYTLAWSAGTGVAVCTTQAGARAASISGFIFGKLPSACGRSSRMPRSISATTDDLGSAESVTRPQKREKTSASEKRMRGIELSGEPQLGSSSLFNFPGGPARTYKQSERAMLYLNLMYPKP